MKLLRGVSSAALCATITGVLACGGGKTPVTPTPTPTPTPRAVVKILLDPNPVVAVPSGDSEYPWALAVNLQVSDSGGVGFTVTSMVTTITAASSGLTLTNPENPFAGMKIGAFSQHTVQFRWPSYRMDTSKTKEGTFNVRMNFVDDNGFPSVGDSTVTIQHIGDPGVELP